MTGNGYFYVHSPTHPFRSQKRLVMEHRLVMEAHLRSIDPGSSFLTEVAGELYLRPEIDVHHRDHDKTNNVVENLQCLTKAEHSRLHQAERR